MERQQITILKWFVTKVVLTKCLTFREVGRDTA